MELFIALESLSNGLRVAANGAPLSHHIFPRFGKGVYSVLVEVRRGPTEHSYSPPILGWREACGAGLGIKGDHDGDRHGIMNLASVAIAGL